MKKVRIAINGFGRIGRMTTRVLLNNEKVKELENKLAIEQERNKNYEDLKKIVCLIAPKFLKHYLQQILLYNSL